MTSKRPVRVVGLLLLLGGVVLVANVVSSEPAGSDASGNEAYTVVYSVADLPVYRLSGGKGQIPGTGAEFDPSILTAHIKSWSQEAEVTPYPQNLSIVVCQTEANHEKLQKLLTSLREKAAK